MPDGTRQRLRNENSWTTNGQKKSGRFVFAFMKEICWVDHELGRLLLKINGLQSWQQISTTGNADMKDEKVTFSKSKDSGDKHQTQKNWVDHAPKCTIIVAEFIMVMFVQLWHEQLQCTT